MNRRVLFLACVVLVLAASSAFAQLVTPVNPGGGTTTYNGSCSFVSVTGTVVSGSPYNTLQAESNVACTGTFVGKMTLEVHVEYMPKSYSKVTLAPQGSVSQTWDQYTGIPAAASLYTSGFMLPSDYYSRAVSTVRWETPQIGCSGFATCGRIWTSRSATGAWQ
jgi:hypothetical protein